jgi:hypothetical protein
MAAIFNGKIELDLRDFRADRISALPNKAPEGEPKHGLRLRVRISR